MKFHLYLPQLKVSLERLVAAARDAEAAGFEGMAGMDHMDPPAAVLMPTYEAMVTNTWLAAHTSKLLLGSLVICDAFRHPAVFAREAVTLDHASNGRFELGIGWGSYVNDFDKFGIGPKAPRDRVQRLRETLVVLKALWAGEDVEFEGEYHHFHNGRQLPVPLTKIPIIIGGSGPKTLALIRDHADWWNMDVRHHEKFEGEQFAELRAQIGNARVSMQQMIAFVPRGADRQAISDLAWKRFPTVAPVVGTGSELVEHFQRLEAQGVERVYTWFCDFAQPETLAAFGEEVIAKLDKGS